MNEDIGVRARATLSTLAEVCHPDWLAGFATHEKDWEALLKKHGNVVAEEMERKLVEKGKMLDQKAEELAKVRKELSDYAKELNLGDAKRLPEDELVTVNVRGQDITTAFKHWKKSPMMEMVLQASRKDKTKPFLDKDPCWVLRVVEYLSNDESMSFDEWYMTNDEEVLSRHYANYLGLTKPNRKKTRKRKAETASAPNWRRVSAPFIAPKPINDKSASQDDIFW
eukprot:CAMPEP_0167824754 /NCGR_PEP_ID=MMETSP0112_2-20121227/8977_1 /TAXON_ID=91324 /ORGANISM="Lotharella globosa, Strain CCCM811" /LENGTH=224 /DNA_ID=CAMNT_0007726767 /DNA_START=104 /DNA_END=778 /DNA_ORIENTATION=+